MSVTSQIQYVGFRQAWVQQNNLRVTWQVMPKVKVAGEQKMDHWCQCPNQLSATRAPETGVEFRFPRLRQEHLEFTMPVTNKLLLEGVGMHLFERWGNMDLHVAHGSFDNQGSFDNPLIEQTFPQMISVVEQGGAIPGLRYRVNNSFNNTVVPNYTYRVAASYVTGTQSFKAGWNVTFGCRSRSSPRSRVRCVHHPQDRRAGRGDLPKRPERHEH